MLSCRHLTLLLLANLAAAPVFAHPVSFTDAWIRVDDAVQVRLNVFLDDIARHQNLPLDSEQLIPAAAMQQAVEQHSETLLRQLKIFDRTGRPLTGEVISLPRWQPAEAGIQLDADSSLKISWNLRYTAQDSADAPDLSALTFLHDFTHLTLDQPGELRLHVKRESTGRRVDAVVAPRRPHTVVLPDADATNAAPLSDDELSGLVARLTVTRLETVLELTGPLLLPERIDGVFADDSPGQNDLVTLKPELAEQLRNHWQTWASEHVQVDINSRRQAAEDLRTSLLSPAGDVYADREAAETAGRPVSSEIAIPSDGIPLMGTRIGVRLVYPATTPARSVQVRLTQSPGDFDWMTVNLHSFADSRTLTIPVQSGAAAASAVAAANSSVAAEFDWQSGSLSRSLTAAAAQIDFNRIAANPLWTRPQSVRQPASAAIGILLAVAAAGLLFVRRGRGRSLAAGLLVAAVAVPVTAGLWTEARSVRQQPSQELTEQLLNGVYRSVMLPDERQSIDRLSQLLLPDATEQVFLAAARSIGTESTGAPVVDIESVRCNDCVARPHAVIDNAIAADCRWTVSGLVTHWGHAHQRDITISGRLTLAPDDQRWKIGEVTLTAVDCIQ